MSDDVPSTKVGSLDMAKPSDRVAVIAAVKRWGLDDATKRATVAAVKEAMAGAALEGNARDVAACARVLTAMEGQNQADELAAAKEARLDEGKPTERVEGQVFKLEFDRAG